MPESVFRLLTSANKVSKMSIFCWFINDLWTIEQHEIGVFAYKNINTVYFPSKEYITGKSLLERSIFKRSFQIEPRPLQLGRLWLLHLVHFGKHAHFHSVNWTSLFIRKHYQEHYAVLTRQNTLSSEYIYSVLRSTMAFRLGFKHYAPWKRKVAKMVICST